MIVNLTLILVQNRSSTLRLKERKKDLESHATSPRGHVASQPTIEHQHLAFELLWFVPLWQCHAFELKAYLS